MDKLLALHSEEQRNEQRFKETMTHRDQILKAKHEIAIMEKQTLQIQQEINVMEPRILQYEMDVKMLETQIEEITKNIRETLVKALKHEAKLKKSKETFQIFLREKTEKTKALLVKNKHVESTDVPKDPLGERGDTSASPEIVWALQGEIDALAIIAEYQTKKIEETDHITNVVGEPFLEAQ